MDAPPDTGTTPPEPGRRSLPGPQLALVAVVLALPVLALVWVSSYAKATPELWGFPFFYWYQFLWVFLAAICTSVAYRVVTAHERRTRGDIRGTRTTTTTDDGADR
ncbi:hypothetical protein GCM10027446_29540 [Angustibacter peucedani]